MNSNQHQPVLIDQIINFLVEQKFDFKNTAILDGTFGGGGYTNFFLKKGVNKILATDWDEEAVKLGEVNFAKYILEKKLTLKQQNYLNFIKTLPKNSLDLIILDLGFSSNQLSFSGRGFSYQKLNEPLDLRYSLEIKNTAFQKILKLKTGSDLAKIIYRFSGEKFAKPIGNAIYKTARSLPNQEKLTVQNTVDAVKQALPNLSSKQLQKTLSRTWQALRVWVNREFENIQNFLLQSQTRLKKQGFLIVVSFHSLEDKIVTQYFRDLAKAKVVDVFGNKRQDFKLFTNKAIVPEESEIANNPRARSAMMRILQNIQEQ